MFNSWNALVSLAVQVSEKTAEGTDPVDPAVKAAETVSDAVTASGGNSLTPWLLLAGVFLVLVVPFVVGSLIAGALRAKEFSMRIGVTLMALTLGLSPFVVKYLNGTPADEMLRLGIDLAGGTNMVFQVMPEEGKQITPDVMDKMVGAIGKRINPSGTEEIVVRAVGADRIEVIIPGADPQTVDEIKRNITRLGTLEFYITAHSAEESTVVRQALALDPLTKELTDSGSTVIAKWLPAYEKNGVPVPLDRSDAIRRKVTAERTVEGRVEEYETEEYLMLVDPPEQRVSGRFLTSATPGMDPQDGRPQVSFRFNSDGAFKFGQLTGRYRPRDGHPRRGLAIVLDGQVYSAPNIEGVITTNGQITGDFTAAETKALSDVLNAGALEVPINEKPLSEATVDPTLGEDVRNKGLRALAIASFAVVAFMIIYYRFAGMVAVLCLLINVVLVFGSMVLINATFTLPGLAGIVLVIGMAIDANVLIFERMREETNRGASLRMSIRNGFSKAFSTIIDANLTTLITAVILFMIGTDQVRGFAVTLFIGIVMSMFTALYVGRLIFELAEKKGWITKLTMSSFVGETNWDFLGKRGLAITLSLLMIVGGLAAFFVRGADNYDIDFTGGTMVTFQVTESAETDTIREILAAQFPGNFTVERLTLPGDDQASAGRHFRLRTTESDSEATQDEKQSAEERVSSKVNAAFAGNTKFHLLKVTMEHTAPELIAISDDDESPAALQLRRFNGGHTVDMTFDTEVAIGTISDQLENAFQKLPAADGQKYADADALFEISGTEGSGVNSDRRGVRKYSKVAVRAKANVPAEDFSAALSGMKTKLDESPLFDEVNTFASAVASEMKQAAIVAIIVSMFAIIGYIWVRFQQVTFGLAAAAALLHDVLIVLGLVAVGSWFSGNPVGDFLLLQDFRVNLPMVAAFLTIVGYSLNDTIVVFDRIREVRGKNPKLTSETVNISLNQTLSRTMLTSLTTLLVVVILYAVGGEGIHGFAYCLSLGIVVGTYSSIYVASPILVWLMNRGD